MVGALLLRGMLVGLLAGILSFAFLKVVGEPQVERAIAVEAALDEAKAGAHGSHDMAMPGHEADTELVSRPTQAGIGLLTGVGIYNVAFGGLFALVFALAYGRMGSTGPRTTAALLAAMGFVAVALVPSLKYPASPPAVGDPDTIGLRTAIYFATVAISLAAMIGACLLRRRLVGRLGPWNAALMAGAAYLVAMVVVMLVLPSVNEVPAHFPADVLWQFRIASVGAQAIMWGTIGLVFGALTERAAVHDGLWRAPGRVASTT